MTKARNIADLLDANGDVKSASLDNVPAVDLTNLSASNLTSGTIPDARVSSSAVSQHATSFDDNAIVNDLSTIALRQATNENAIAYNTNSSFVDVFQDASGIASHTTSARNSSEYVSSTVLGSNAYETGDKSSVYTMSSEGITISSGSINNLVDGTKSYNSNSSGSFYWSTGTLDGSENIFFDLGSGNSKIFTGAKWYQNTTDSHGNWRWLGGTNSGTWVELHSSFVLSHYETEKTWSNTTPYRYMRLNGVSGTRSSGSWNDEVEFKVQQLSTNATGNFISNTITAPSSTSKMGAIITYQDQAGTNALNSDIILQLSADNGSNFTTATLTALPNFATGIKMAKVNDLAVTAGTQLKYKISFANQSSGSKEARIRGVSLQY